HAHRRAARVKRTRDFAARARRVRLLVLDVDGVLTDGRMIISERGDELKFFHTHDGMGINLARRAGITVALVTGEKSPIAQARGRPRVRARARRRVTGGSDRSFLGLVIAVIVGLPAIIAALVAARAPAGQVYVGMPSPTGEYALYYSYVRQARDGAWIFANLHTTEAYPPIANLQFLAVGLFGRLTH